MGMMKRFLEQKIAEYAKIVGISEQTIYESDEWYALAVKYAEQNLKGGANAEGESQNRQRTETQHSGTVD